MPKLIIMRGICGSGKTTTATKILKEQHNCVRIGRNDIREMLFKGLEWNLEREKMVARTEAELLDYFMILKKNIIIDNVHLNPHHYIRYNKIATQYGYTLQIVNLAPPLPVCIERDTNRKDSSGRDSILNLAYEHGFAEQDRELVIYDLETLFDTSQRLELATLHDCVIDEIYYDHHNLAFDEIRSSVLRDLVSSHELGYEIILISTRPEYLRKATEEYLIRWHIPYSRLILNSGPSISVEEIKRSYLRFIDKDWCSRVVDIEPNSIKMWESEDLNVFNPLEVLDGIAC